MKFCTLWILGALAIVVPISDNLLRYHRLEHGLCTAGVVTGLEPWNHQAVHYKFNVAGKDYSASGRAGFGNPEFNSLGIGQQVAVYYLPGNPDESCLGIPSELEENEIVPLALAGIIFPLIAIAGFSFRYARFRRWLFG